MNPVYLNDWKDGGFIQLVADFEDIFMTADEYKATNCPLRNVQMWEENKSKLETLGPIAVDQAMIDRATRTCVTGRIYSPPVTDDEWRTALTAALRPAPPDSGEK